MKVLFSLLFLMLTISGFSQDTTATANTNQETQTTMFTPPANAEPVAYTLDDLEFLFIPEEMGYRIARIENGREVDYGHLRQTTDDGYFVMTSILNDHVSYGRFDDAGNFKALRLDEETDKVIEEHFLVKE